MKYLKVFYGVLVLLGWSSCATTAIRRSVTQESAVIRKTDILTNPQIADLKIEERKIEGTVEVRKQDYANPLEDAKALAIRKATIDGKCDLIAQPNFEVIESPELVNVKVEGFAAHYKNFRPMVAADTGAFVIYEKIRNLNDNGSSGVSILSNPLSNNKTATASNADTGVSGGVAVLIGLILGLGLTLLIGVLVSSI